MAKDKTAEQNIVAEAPVVEEIVDAVAEKTPAERWLEDQFGGPDGEPREGVTRLDNLLREQLLQADELEQRYRTVLAAKTANRTILRAFAQTGSIPQDVVELFYKTQNRKGE